MNGSSDRQLAEGLRAEALSDLLWAEICGDPDGFHRRSALLHGQLAAVHDHRAAAGR
jgi:hypothetical protein